MSPQQERQTNDSYERLAKGLGWFSIGLGLSELLAAGPMATFIGVRNSSDNRSVLRAYGVREIGTGIGILARERPVGWVWGRVAGDLLDIGSLIASAPSSGSDGARIARSVAAVLGVTALDFYCASQLDRLPAERGRDEQSHKASNAAVITVNGSPEDLYRRMRDFMRMRGESGDSRVFTSGIEIAEEPAHATSSGSEGLRWTARPGIGVSISGNIRCEAAPAGRGTIVRAEIATPSSGMVTRVAGKLFNIAGGEVLQNELRKFKQLVETGEIATSDATARPGIHAAQPAREPVNA